MTQQEQRALDIIRQRGGEASVHTIARTLGMSLEYARSLCLNLGERDYIDFVGSTWCRIPEKKKQKGKTSKSRKSSTERSLFSEEKSRKRILEY